MMAVPSTKEYGSLAVLVQSLAKVSIVRRLPPSAFWPEPKVDSAIVAIHPDPQLRSKVADVPAYRAFLRDLYTHRRKNLRQALSGWPSGRRDKKDIDARLAAAGIDGSARSETLDLQGHMQLFDLFRME